MESIYLDTDLENLEFSNDLLAVLSNQLGAYVFIKDKKRHYVYINDKMRRLFGLPCRTSVIYGDEMLLLPEMHATSRESDDKVLIDGKISEKLEEIRDPYSNEPFYYKSVKLPIYNKSRKVIGLLGISTDITVLKQQEEKLEILANTDSLTELYNRRFFMNQAEKELSRARRHNTPISLIVGDVDLFKRVNDELGHLVGDAVLKEISSAIRGSIRLEDTVARMGGEEFAILLPDTKLEGALATAEKIRSAIEALEISNSDKPVKTTMSFGVSSSEASPLSIDDLYGRADEALYTSKGNGRNCVTAAEMALSD